LGPVYHVPDLISLAPNVFVSIETTQKITLWKKVGSVWTAPPFHSKLPYRSHSEWHHAYICATGTTDGNLALFYLSPDREKLELFLYNQAGHILSMFYYDPATYTWSTVSQNQTDSSTSSSQPGHSKSVNLCDDIPLFREENIFTLKQRLSKTCGLYPLRNGFATLRGKHNQFFLNFTRRGVKSKFCISLPSGSTDNFKDVIELTNGTFATLSLPSSSIFNRSPRNYKAKIILWDAQGAILKEIESNIAFDAIFSSRDGSFAAFMSEKIDDEYNYQHCAGQWDQNGQKLPPPPRGFTKLKYFNYYYPTVKTLDLGYGYHFYEQELRDPNNKSLRSINHGHGFVQVDDRTLAGLTLRGSNNHITVWEFPALDWGIPACDSGKDLPDSDTN